MRWQRLFREAAQLKTDSTAVCVAGMEGRHAKTQMHAGRTAERRRPAVTVVADGAQRTLAVVAVAWGGLRDS